MYIAKKSEYEDIMKVKSRKRLSLKRKKRPEEQVLSVDEESTSAAVIHRLETKVDKVNLHTSDMEVIALTIIIIVIIYP